MNEYNKYSWYEQNQAGENGEVGEEVIIVDLKLRLIYWSVSLLLEERHWIYNLMLGLIWVGPNALEAEAQEPAQTLIYPR